MTLDRRAFMRYALAGVLLPARGRAQGDAGSTQGKGVAADTLRNPALVGRGSEVLGPLDNDPGVIALERRLRCSCGCTLDVYTCRTTDFTCTYSPAMHKDVTARWQRGEAPEQIVQAFVKEYGETVLMAPEARGFNLAGYLVPGLAFAAVGLGMAAYLTRRRRPVPVPEGATAPEGAPVAVSADQADRLRRALEEVES